MDIRIKYGYSDSRFLGILGYIFLVIVLVAMIIAALAGIAIGLYYLIPYLRSLFF